MNPVVCVRAIVAAMGLVVAPAAFTLAHAGVEEDYKAGMFAFDRSDFAAALPALRRAADGGHVEAQLALARVLQNSDAGDEAVVYYRRAAEAGNIEATYLLGTMVGAGEGTAKDAKEAYALIAKAANAGFREAIGAMAQIYIIGELDLTPEQKTGPEALAWIRKAADQGFVIALEALEKAYREGQFGLSVDGAKADEIRRKITSIRGAPGKKRRLLGDKQ